MLMLLIDVKTLQEGVDIFKAYKGGYDLVTNKINKLIPTVIVMK